MEDLKPVISKNISELRRAKGMTQFELSELLNYSDKAVSKWERGESLPDIAVLKQIADIFSVSVDYLLTDGHEKKEERRVEKSNNHILITAMAVVLVWLAASAAFVICRLIPSLDSALYPIAFLYAVPVSLIVWLVFDCVWFSARHIFGIISLLMWFVFVSVHISLLMFAGINFKFIYLLGISGQVIIILWSRIKKK